MPSYADLMNQAKALMEKAEQVRKEELQAKINEIRALMKEYGITAADLGAGGGVRKASKSKAPAKYKGPNGELWSGGPGRKPGWVAAVLASGKSIEDYRI